MHNESLSDWDRRGVRIDIPSGSYRATFQWNAEASPEIAGRESGNANVELVVEPDPVPPRELAVHPEVVDADHTEDMRVGRTHHIRAVIAAVTLCILILGGAFVLIRANTPEKAFRTFWAPWMTGSKPVIISIGSNAVYRFHSTYLDRYAEQHGLKNAGEEFYVPFEKGQMLSTDDLFPAYQSFVALGDVAAVSRIVATLTQGKKPYQERFPNDISFAELRDTPSVLVGGFNNPMALELTKQLEFVMRGGDEIVDTLDPKRKWQLNVLQHTPDLADYAIITRLVRRGGDAPYISVAGLGQYGTLAAADVICNPRSIHLVTDPLPKDWGNKNLQMVLRISVVDFKPAVSGVVAFRSW